jgi:hypothetical protein
MDGGVQESIMTTPRQEGWVLEVTERTRDLWFFMELSPDGRWLLALERWSEPARATDRSSQGGSAMALPPSAAGLNRYLYETT